MTTISSFLSIDPGLHCSGLAFWHVKVDMTLHHFGTLSKASYFDLPAKIQGVEAWTLMAEGIRAWAESCNEPDYHVVAELPQVYTWSKSKGDPNDLIQLAGCLGAIVGVLQRPTYLFRPYEWKKQLPKEITRERCLNKLSQAEINKIILPKAKSLGHNVWDAVGLGIFFLENLNNSK